MSHGLRTLQTGFKEYAAWATDDTPRIGWRLPFFDRPTNGGVGRSEVCMIMACSSVGKTAIGLNIVKNNPKIPAIIFSLEMSWRMMSARLAAMVTGVKTRWLEEQLKQGGRPGQIDETVSLLPNVLCDDTPNLKLKDMQASFNEAHKLLGEPPRIVVMDFLELIGDAGALTAPEQVDRVSRRVRDWTRMNDTSTFLLHQVGEGASDGASPLSLSDGRYGGHAPMDYVVGAYAPRLAKGISGDWYDNVKDQLWLQLLKNRNGEANPYGQIHRLDSSCLHLSEWRYQVQQPAFDLWPNPLDDD